MRLTRSVDSDPVEAQRWASTGIHELTLLKMRMASQGADHGQYQRPLSDSAYCIVAVLGSGLESVHIHAPPVGKSVTQPAIMYFEFGSSGFPVLTWSGTQGGIGFTAYNGCVVGVTINSVTMETKAEINTGQRQLTQDLASKVGRLFQAQLNDEPSSYLGTDTIYTTLAPINPYTGIYAGSVNWEAPQFTNTETSAEQSFSQRDAGFDVPFEYGQSDNKVQLAVLRGGADWPRATGIQTVTEPTIGSQKFAVYIDAFCKVYVFPLAGITEWSPDFTQNIDAGLVKSAAIPLPLWAFAPPAKAMDQISDVNSWMANSPDIAWKISPGGTKACAVLHERELAVIDSAYLDDPLTHFRTTGDVSSLNPGQTGTQQRFWQSAGISGVDNTYTFGRGVFEIGVKIVLTGPGLADFTLSLAPNEIRAPRTSDRGTFLVDYAWQDIPSKGVLAGDMLLLDIERWYQPDAAIHDPSEALAGNWYLTGPSATGFRNWELMDISMADWFDAVARGDFGFIFQSPYGNPNPPVLAFQGAGAVARNKWSQPFVTGQALSFFSLRKRRGSDESEVTAIPGEALLGVDLRTASLVVAIEVEETVQRSVQLGTDHPDNMETTWAGRPVPVNMPHRISHPGVAIYTQAKLRTVLMPDTANEVTKSSLQAKAAMNPRSALAETWAYMPANDLRDWSALSSLRDFQIGMHNEDAGGTVPERLPHTAPAHPLQAVGVKDRNWWIAGMCVNSCCLPLLCITKPNFGWAVYTSEIINRMQNVNTTFWTHPNGSWAFYDHNRVYNTYGVPDIFQTYTAENADSIRWRSPLPDIPPYGATQYLVLGLTLFEVVGPPDDQVFHYGLDYVSGPIEPAAYSQMRKFNYDSGGPVPTFMATAFPDSRAPLAINVWNDYDTLTPAVSGALFKHQIFDSVHFEKAAADGSIATKDTSFLAMYNEAVGRLVGATDLTPITSEQLRAKFTTLAETSVRSHLALQVEWPAGNVFYGVEWSYKNTFGALDNPNPVYRGGFLLKPRFSTAPWCTGPSGGNTRVVVMPPTFSTCLMLDLP